MPQMVLLFIVYCLYEVVQPRTILGRFYSVSDLKCYILGTDNTVLQIEALAQNRLQVADSIYTEISKLFYNTIEPKITPFEKYTDEILTPIAIAGRVLAFPYENREGFRIGDPVCAGPGGTVSLMTREEVKMWPDRIVGVVSSIPGGVTCGHNDDIYINGRIWIRVI